MLLELFDLLSECKVRTKCFPKKLVEAAEIKPKTSVPYILAPSAHKVPSALALHNNLTDEGGLS